MNSKANLYMALTASLMVFTVMYAGYQGPANYPVLSRYQGVNPYQDAATIQFEHFYGPVGCAFDVYTREDPNSCVVDVNVPGFLAVQGSTVPDPNGTGYVTEYRFDFVPPDPNLHNVDITTTGNTCRPQIRVGRGIVMGIPFWLPRGVAYLNAMDPNSQGRTFQEYFKTRNTLGGKGPRETERWVNDTLYLARINGKVAKP